MKKIDVDNLKLVFIVDGEETDLRKKYRKELKIAEETINEDLKNQASLFAFYAVVSELANDELSQAKLKLELVEATLAKTYRDKKLVTGEKVTEKIIQEAVALDKNRIKAVTDLNEAKKSVGVLKAIKESFHHRKESVIALASNMRAQRDVEFYLKKEDYKKKIKK